MAKRKRRSKNRHTGRNWIISILAVIVIFLGVYVGHHFYRIWNQQRIEQEAREKDRRAKQLFIQQVAPEAQAMQNTYHVYASITIAQAILESQWGTSQLASQYHNLFGIKGSYNGNSVVMRTREVYGGRSVYVNANFRAYANNSESVTDHGRFLNVNSRYSNLLGDTNYVSVANKLQQDG